METRTVIIGSLLGVVLLFFLVAFVAYQPFDGLWFGAQRGHGARPGVVCEIPLDIGKSATWIGYLSRMGTTAEIVCEGGGAQAGAGGHGAQKTPKPVAMLYNSKLKRDELKRASADDGLLCKYQQLSMEDEDSLKVLGPWVQLKLGQVLTREDLASDKGETRFVRVVCLDEKAKKAKTRKKRSFEVMASSSDELASSSDEDLTDYDSDEDGEKQLSFDEDGIVFYQMYDFLPDLSSFAQTQKAQDEETAQAEAQASPSPSQPRPSVLVLVLESTTRLNFHRSMPKTAAALRDLGGPVFYLKGLTRIGDNTFPNMLAATTGLLEPDIGGGYKLDELPFIWRLYEKAGWATAFLDDSPPLSRSMLSYGQEGGFTRPPTTYYPQPFWTFWNTLERPGDGENCFDNRSRAVPGAHLEQVERFVRHAHASAVAHFTLAMLIRTTHYSWQDAARLDVFYAPFLKRMAPYLENTILVVMGDHGDRFSDEMLYLPSGRIESRLPLLAIRLPGKILERYPSWGNRLLENKKRLTTNLDLHKTLVELLRMTPSGVKTLKKETVHTKAAYSLMTEAVPLYRTCDDARIPDLYCVCTMMKQTQVNQTLVRELVDQFLVQLNAMLPVDKCRRLSLHKLNSSVLYEAGTWMDVLTFKQTVEFTVDLAPSGAQLRTKMSRTALSDWTQVTVSTEIERLNMYGNQSHCLEHRILRKYCLCHDVLGDLERTTVAPDVTMTPVSGTGGRSTTSTGQTEKNHWTLPKRTNKSGSGMAPKLGVTGVAPGSEGNASTVVVYLAPGVNGTRLEGRQ